MSSAASKKPFAVARIEGIQTVATKVDLDKLIESFDTSSLQDLKDPALETNMTATPKRELRV